MSAPSNLRTRLWTCCQCHETRIPMSTGDCPSCNSSRCIDCDVAIYSSTVAEAEEEPKVTRAVAESSRSSQAIRQAQPAASSTSYSTVPPILESSFNNSEEFRRVVPPRLRSRGGDPVDGVFVITLISDDPNSSIYVLGPRLQALARLWDDILPEISSACASECSILSSMHLFRFGPTVHTSLPTIIINSKTLVSIEEKLEIQKVIETKIRYWRQLESEHHIYNAVFTCEIQLLFKISRLRRSVDSPHSDEIRRPICNPRNTRFKELPQTGDSIGTIDYSDETVTLGCYLMLNDREVVALTVDHLLPQNCSSSALTHVSLQDQRAFSVPILIRELCRILYETSHSCEICAPISTADLNMLSEKDLWDYIERFWPPGSPHRLTSCDIEIELAAAVAVAMDEHEVENLGPLLERSSQRYGTSSPFICILNDMREMDWAIYDITNERLRGNLSRQSELSSRDPSYRGLTLADNIKPGSFVKSVGRTSGYQIGQISDTVSAVFHEDYITQEWSVIRRPETSVEDWVCGGIGVEGDSGALIVDESSNKVYGMLWGRIGEDSTTITLFTPMRELLDDIRDTRYCKGEGLWECKLELVEGQKMVEEDISRSERVVPSVPISHRHSASEQQSESTGELSSAFAYLSTGTDTTEA